MALPVHVSTLGLSVYNVLALAGCGMKPEQLLASLQSYWAPEMEQSELDAGIAYLLDRNLVSFDEDNTLRPPIDSQTNKARRLHRIGDGTELGF